MDIYCEQLKTMISKHIEIDSDLENDIHNYFSIKHIKSSEHFLRAGEIQQEGGFVISGIFRYYYIDISGKEMTKHFSVANNFVLSFSAIYEKVASFNIQAIEDSVILTININDFLALTNNNIKWQQLYIRLLEKTYLIKEKRTADFLLKDAKQRYIDLIKTNPDICKKVKQTYIAQFLGISPVSLSRIRGEINKC